MSKKQNTKKRLEWIQVKARNMRDHIPLLPDQCRELNSLIAEVVDISVDMSDKFFPDNRGMSKETLCIVTLRMLNALYKDGNCMSQTIVEDCSDTVTIEQQQDESNSFGIADTE